MRAQDVASQLQESTPKRSAAVETFINVCGKIQLFNKDGIKYLLRLHSELVELEKKTDKTTTDEQSYRALIMLINILANITKEKDRSYPNNNYNFLSTDQQILGFYEITFPNGKTPKVGNDLDAAVSNILMNTLSRFKASELMPLTVRMAYSLLSSKMGDPVLMLRNDLGLEINNYEQKKLLGTMKSLANIETQLEEMSHVEGIPTLIKEAKIDFTQHNDTGLEALMAGILLPKLIECQTRLIETGVSHDQFASMLVNLPKAPEKSEIERFQGGLNKFCNDLADKINPLLTASKDSKQKPSPLFYLQKDIMKAKEQANIPLACIQIYTALLEATANVYQKGADPKSLDLLNKAMEECKALIAHYSPTMSLAGLTVPQQKKDSPIIATKAEVNVSASRPQHNK